MALKGFFNFFVGTPKRVFLTVLLFSVVAAFALREADRPPYIIIEAKTGIVKYRVQRQHLTSIALQNANIKYRQPDGTVINRTITGVLAPTPGTIVTYRFLDETLSVMLEGNGNQSPGVLDLEEGEHETLPPSRISITQSGKNRIRPLPIAGATEIGQEIGAPSGSSQNFPYLYGGSVYVFGRTSSPGYRDRLYPQDNASFPIPAGGRISSGDFLASKNSKSSVPAMYGIAEVEGGSLKVSLSTVTDQLHLYRPGRTGEVETLGIGFLNQILIDPSYGLVILFISIFSFLLSVFSSFKLTERSG